jgi:hypothetical protein
VPVDAEPRSHRLPTTVTPRHYDLTLAPDLVDATFSGTASIEVDVHEPVATVHLHALDLVVTQARVEQAGRSLAAIVHLDETTEQAVLSLDTDLDLGPAVVHLEFSGTLNDKLVGFYRSTFTDHEGRSRTLACTQFESTHARRAFPCWDEPAFKATFSITLEVADDLLVLSNAAECSRESLPDGRISVSFARTIKMSTYLVAFVVGPLEVGATAEVDGVALRVIAPPGRAAMTGFAAEVASFSLRYLSDWYGIAYPGDKVDLIAIPDFAFGAMENLGCITFRETALLVDPASCHPGRTAAGGRRHRPRTRPHVVRRPGHNGLVERHLAERGLRHLHGGPHRRRLPPRVGALGRFRDGPVDGLRHRLTHLDPSHRVRGGHRRGRRGHVRRPHLREGRIGGPDAPAIPGRGPLPGRDPPLPAHPRLREHRHHRPVGRHRGIVRRTGAGN